MKKIPVGQTIVHAYRFASGGFADLFRLLWLPAVGAAVCGYLTNGRTGIFSYGLRSHDFSGLGMPRPLLILIYLLSIVFIYMQLTAAFQLALGQITARGRWFYLPLLQRPLWRLIGAVLLLMLTLAVLAVVYLLAMLVIGFLFGLGFHAAHMSDAAIGTGVALDTSLAQLAGLCGFIFCAARFGFLLGAATIAEERIGLFRAWLLSHGNFWRIFAVGLAVFLPILVIEVAFLIGIGGFRLPPPGATPAQIQATQTIASLSAEAAIMRYWYLFYPVFVIVMVWTYGLAAGSQVFAYRALTEDAPIPSPP